MPGSWSDYLELRTGTAPPPSPEGGDVRVYADGSGDLRAVQSDGTDAPIGGGGGFSPVTCVLEVYPLNVHGSVTPLCKWNHLFDNPKDLNTLGAIPAGLGLSFAFDGSSEQITTAEAGTWAFTMGLSVTGDDTWRGSPFLDQNEYVGTPLWGPDNTVSPNLSVSEVVSVPAGYTLNPQVFVFALATADPYNADVYLNIVRLA